MVRDGDTITRAWKYQRDFQSTSTHSSRESVVLTSAEIDG